MAEARTPPKRCTYEEALGRLHGLVGRVVRVTINAQTGPDEGENVALLAGRLNPPTPDDAGLLFAVGSPALTSATVGFHVSSACECVRPDPDGTTNETWFLRGNTLVAVELQEND